MPKHKRAAGSMSLTAGQARFVLNRLLQARTINQRDVDSALRGISDEISALEEQLNDLRGEGAVTRGAPRRAAAPASSSTPSGDPPTSKRRRQNLTPERRAALKRQGHYLALMRQVPKTRRAFFSNIFKTKGGATAISALKKSLGK